VAGGPRRALAHRRWPLRRADAVHLDCTRAATGRQPRALRRAAAPSASSAAERPAGRLRTGEAGSPSSGCARRHRRAGAHRQARPPRCAPRCSGAAWPRSTCRTRTRCSPAPRRADLLRLLRPWPRRATCRAGARGAGHRACWDLPLAELLRAGLFRRRPPSTARRQQLRRAAAAWQTQGVLAMLRQRPAPLQLPARWLARAGGERRLTNVLHLAELLQARQRQLEGEPRCCAGWPALADADASAGRTGRRRAGAAPGKRRRPGARSSRCTRARAWSTRWSACPSRRTSAR
jgi:hypothetical protein